MSSPSGFTRAAPVVGARILLTSQINVLFVALGSLNHMGMPLVGLASGLGSWSGSLRCTECWDGLPYICGGTKEGYIIFIGMLVRLSAFVLYLYFVEFHA